MAPIPSDRKGLTLKYSSGIAPLVTAARYSELIDNYKKTGIFPHILDLGGMAIDTSRNRNKWRVPLEDLQAVADKLKGLPLMKDHDIDHVDSIIGKVEEAWVEPDKNDPTAGKVFWKGETCDESIIQKILLGYIKHNSIQIAVPRAYCDDCMSAQGKKEEEAAIDDLDLPCPRCGSLNMLIRGPMPLEQSIIAIPAYEKADVTPFGFKASLDFALRARYEPKEAPPVAKPVPKVAKVVLPDLTPLLFEAMNAVGMLTAEVVEVELRMAKMALEGYPEDRVEIRYSQKAKDLGSDKPIGDEGFTPEEQAFLDSIGKPVDEPMEEEKPHILSAPDGQSECERCGWRGTEEEVGLHVDSNDCWKGEEEANNLPPGTSVMDLPGYDDRVEDWCDECDHAGSTCKEEDCECRYGKYRAEEATGDPLSVYREALGYAEEQNEEAMMVSLKELEEELRAIMEEGGSETHYGGGIDTHPMARDIQTEETKGGSLEDFPLVEKGGEKGRKEEGKCVCTHARGYHQEDGCHAPTSYFPGAACSCTVYEEAGKKEEASEYVGMPCPECKIGEMVDDGKGGANCPNCGWPSDKKEEDKCIWCNPIGLNLRSIEATHEDCTCKEPCDESFCMAKA